MMNVLELQDNLKNFSEDQLINEMQQPSGNVPQYLVLSEINRRKRIKDNYQQQQQAEQSKMTVAQEKLAGAGVPAEGLAGLAASMAPKTDITENTGATPDQTMPLPEAPAPMAELPRNDGIAAMAGGGYVRRYQLGGPMGVPGRATMVDGFFVELLPDGTAVDQRTGQPVPPEIAQKAQAKLMSPSGPMPPAEPMMPSGGGVFDASLPAPILAPDMPRQPPDLPAVGVGLQGIIERIPEEGLPLGADDIIPDEPPFANLSSVSEVVPSSGSRGRTQSVTPRVVPDPADVSPGSVVRPDTRSITPRVVPDPADVSTGSDVRRLPPEATPLVPDSGDDLNPSMDKATAIRLMTSDDAYAYTPPSPDPDPTKTTVGAGGTGGSAGGGAGSIESQIIEMLKEREKRAESEKWLSLAQAGLALMASDQPTLGGAVGEAGQVGLTRLGEARDDYEGAKMALLKTQQAMQASRAGSGRSRDYNNPSTIGAALARFEELRKGLLGRGTRVVTDPTTGLQKTETVYQTYADLSPDQKNLYDSYSGTIANLARQFSGFFPADMTG
jgi:hypothetical protein